MNVPKSGFKKVEWQEHRREYNPIPFKSAILDGEPLTGGTQVWVRWPNGKTTKNDIVIAHRPHTVDVYINVNLYGIVAQILVGRQPLLRRIKLSMDQ